MRELKRPLNTPLYGRFALEYMYVFPHFLQMDGVIDIHEFHIWSLAGNKVVASLHVHTKDVNDYVSLARRIKNYLHVNGIHSVTIQPEFSQVCAL